MIIQSTWESERLEIRDLNSQEIDEVQALYKTSSDISLWGSGEPEAGYIRHCFLEGDLPPNGTKKNYKIQTIKTNIENIDLIGLLSIYCGYPTENIAYISFLCIGNQFKSLGYGQEVINQLIEELRKLEYKEIRINVSLKNWSALRFWIRLGFDKINGIYGDKEYKENTIANLELSRLL
ncbi:GNAT family N-acetyltransferase [Paenibacillus terrigena]|uniref:GNAT family N-acetyltransferase n=1 Tax=Paenibacillus terrigena TaxID=369333 RepID=UPI0028D75EA6|nr:GNAT family N-acetyltransferase [Paenibacillus terrigena]